MTNENDTGKAPSSLDTDVRRIGQLAAANKPVVSVAPTATLKEAITIMMLEDFSQLPVLQGDRDCKGALTWESIARAIALEPSHDAVKDTVKDCMVRAADVEILESDADLLTAIPRIVKTGFALVRRKDRTFSGIVTVVDLSLQFKDLAEPFLLLEQIEKLLRRKIGEALSLEELRSAKDPEGAAREVNDVADLSLGEYIRLIEREAVWQRLGLAFDRERFLAALQDVREIRNAVMHFDPTPLPGHALDRLRRVAALLRSALG